MERQNAWAPKAVRKAVHSPGPMQLDEPQRRMSAAKASALPPHPARPLDVRSRLTLEDRRIAATSGFGMSRAQDGPSVPANRSIVSKNSQLPPSRDVQRKLVPDSRQISHPFQDRSVPASQPRPPYLHPPGALARPSALSEASRIPISKSANIPDHWQVEDSLEASRKRYVEDLGGRSASRMTVSTVFSPKRRRALPTFGSIAPGQGAVLGPNLELLVDGKKVGGPGPSARDGPSRSTHDIVLGKAARKLQQGRKTVIPEDNNTSEDEKSEADKSSDPSAQDTDGTNEEAEIDSSIDSSEIDQLDESTGSLEIVPDIRPVSPPSVPSEELMQALETLSLSSVRMQKSGRLPFLLRNIRRGFRHRCSLLNIPTRSEVVPSKNITVRYRQSFGGTTENGVDAVDEYEARMSAWLCPLCDLHGSFGTREMLLKHLEWDHGEVDAVWDSNGKIILNILEPVEEVDMTRFPSLSVPSILSEEEGEQKPPPSSTSTPGITSPTPTTDAPSVQQSNSVTREHSPLPPKLKIYPPSPARPSTTRSRSGTTSFRQSRASSIRSSLPSRYPTPPPPSDPLGPSAEPPYLPASSETISMYYSCRPGGERIFDLLSTLPLEPFGVLAWNVVEREEEIFQVDDVRDEDKVMQALWSRWILLNLNKFVENYYQGTVAFIDEYWRMIHRAAGWAALRVWLLMFVYNRFLTGSEIVSILKHYEKRTGMDLWYT